MNRLKRIGLTSLFIFVSLGFFVTGCATTGKEELMPMDEAAAMQEHMAMKKSFPKDYVFPLSDINLEKVIEENEGMKVLRENAMTLRDYYRGGVQEKAAGEKFIKEERWREAMSHFVESNRFLEVVLDYLPEDEPYRNVYGNHFIIFMPNLLIADNHLKLVWIYNKLKRSTDDIYWEKRSGKYYLSQSLRCVETEWAFKIKRELEGD